MKKGNAPQTPEERSLEKGERQQGHGLAVEATGYLRSTVSVANCGKTEAGCGGAQKTWLPQGLFLLEALRARRY